MASPKLPKHHYIPVFYLKKWGGADGRLVEFSRPYGSELKTRRPHADGTGYVRGLYRLPGVSDRAAELLETRFFKNVDDFASYALLRLLRRSLDGWKPELRTAWTLFIVSILIRSPKALADIKARLMEGLPDEWEKARQQHAAEHPDEPPLGDYSVTQVEQSSLLALQRFIANPVIGTAINRMYWSVCDVSPTKFRFLTSDRPVVMTNGIGDDNAHIALPISPTMLFLATKNVETAREIQRMPFKELVFNCNKQVVRHAVKYVWASNESQVALIRSQMSSEANEDRNFFRSGNGEQVPS